MYVRWVGDDTVDAARRRRPHGTARLAMAGLDVAVPDAGERMAGAGRLDEVVVGGARQAEGEAVVERSGVQDRVAPRSPPRSARPVLGLDERERMDGARSGRASRSAAPVRPAGRASSPFGVRIATSWRATTSASRPAMIAGDPRQAVAAGRAATRPAGTARPDRSRPGCSTSRRGWSGAAAEHGRRPLLDRTREESLHEEPLQAEEHEERDHHQQERAGREQMPLRPVLGEQVLDAPGSSGSFEESWTKTRAISRSFQTHRNWKIP